MAKVGRRLRLMGGLVFMSFLLGLAFFSNNDPFPYMKKGRFFKKFQNSFFSPQSSKTVGCILPKIEPQEMSLPGDTLKPPVNCSQNHRLNPISIVDGSFIKLELSPSKGSTTCFYEKILLSDDFNVKIDQKRFLLANIDNNSSSSPSRIPCPVDLFRAVCTVDDPTVKNATIFDSVLRCFPPVPEKTRQKDPPTRFQERLNILMFGLDSMSRVTWLEQMPKTVEFSVEKLGGVTFDGYNIVGDGTTAAFLGFLTGFFEEELHEARRGFSGSKQVDDFPFIWRQLSDYVTLWDEDGAGLGTFHYRLLGFSKPPVDYYGRKFQLAVKVENDGCLGSTSAFEEMLQQFRHVFAVHPDPRRKFALVFNSAYTHSSAGSGNIEAYRVDKMLSDELRWLNEHGHLNESVLILFGDHGSRFGGSRSTVRGKISERLPYLTIIFPTWFRNKYRTELENLISNSKMLTTPFDLHATLLEIGGLKPEPGTPRRGLSFFHPIPSNRTCEDAGVLPHWCSCLEGEEIELDDEIVSRSLLEFERYVNNDLLGKLVLSETCSPLRAFQPFSARLLGLRREVAQFVQSKDFHGREPQFDTSNSKPGGTENLQISFRTEPGHGEWEVTFAWDHSDDKIRVLPKQISRTNRYGNAPKCIQDTYPHLRQFCFCK